MCVDFGIYFLISLSLSLTQRHTYIVQHMIMYDARRTSSLISSSNLIWNIHLKIFSNFKIMILEGSLNLMYDPYVVPHVHKTHLETNFGWWNKVPHVEVILQYSNYVS